MSVRRLEAGGLALAGVDPLVWAPKCNPSNNRERGVVLALGGRCLAEKNNNQPKVGISGGGCI
jgi:hypothetical protein